MVSDRNNPSANNRVRRLVPYILVYSFAAALLAAIVAAHFMRREYPLTFFSGDPTTIMGAPFFVGLLTNVRVLFWCSSASVCLFTYAFMRRRGPSAAAGTSFVLWSGLLMLMFMLDDLFQIHEEVFPTYLHIDENIIYMVYVSTVAFYIFKFAGFIKHTRYLLFVIAICLLGGSLLIDLLSFQVRSGFVEDSLKFLGIISLFTYLFRVCLQEVRSGSFSGPGNVY